jgi:hypothetical protein
VAQLQLILVGLLTKKWLCDFEHIGKYAIGVMAWRNSNDRLAIDVAAAKFGCGKNKMPGTRPGHSDEI